jgi:hypothetical protein
MKGIEIVRRVTRDIYVQLLESKEIHLRYRAGIIVFHSYLIFVVDIDSYRTGTEIFTVGENPVITDVIQGIARDLGISRIRLRRHCTAKRMIRILQTSLSFHTTINLIRDPDRDMKFTFLDHCLIPLLRFLHLPLFKSSMEKITRFIALSDIHRTQILLFHCLSISCKIGRKQAGSDPAYRLPASGDKRVIHFMEFSMRNTQSKIFFPDPINRQRSQ